KPPDSLTAKESLGRRLRFHCCVPTTASSVFTQPRSVADIVAPSTRVRFTPENGHRLAMKALPLRAKRGHCGNGGMWGWRRLPFYGLPNWYDAWTNTP